jgi:hypothetical protein
MAMLSMDRVEHWAACELVDPEGETIGRIEALYVDDTSGAPEFALVRLGVLHREEHLIPLATAQEADGQVLVPFVKELVEEAPGAEDAERLSAEDERRIYEHYGFRRRGQDDAVWTTSETG